MPRLKPQSAETPPPPSKGCLAGLGVLFVSHRGDVYPCGYLPVNCGNILEKSLIEIWDENEDLARMRDVAALEGKCGVCGYKQVCGGLPRAGVCERPATTWPKSRSVPTYPRAAKGTTG